MSCNEVTLGIKQVVPDLNRTKQQIFGLALMIIGAVMHARGDTLRKDEVTSLFNKISFNDNLSFGNVVNSLSICIICIGIVTIVIAILGLLVFFPSKWPPLKKILAAYAIIVLLILVVQLVALGLWSRMAHKVESKLQGELATLLRSYAGVTSTNEVSIGWDLVFLRLDCCGVDAISSTSNSEEFSGSIWWNNRNGTNDKVPQSCCIGATEDNYKSYTSDADCQLNLITHRKKGCYNEFKDWLIGYQISAIIFSVLLILTEIVAIAFAFALLKGFEEVHPAETPV